MEKNYNNFLFILIFCFTISSCSSNDEVVEVPGDTTSATVWKGENKIFTKEDGADHNQSANQDRITPSVWITRASGGGQIFNIVIENSANDNSSPAGTAWSLGNINDINSLSFTDFRSAVGKPKNVEGKNLVMHLIDDNIYLSVKFTSWSEGKNGGFAYERSTE